MSKIVVLPEKSLTGCSILASGEYGDIYSGIYNNKEYAIKSFKLEYPSNLIFSVKELHFLKMLGGSPFIVDLLAVIRGNAYHDLSLNKKNYDKITFVYEKAAYDAYTFVKGGDPDYHYLKFAMTHILLGLEYMHGHGVIHRDIKPQNLLWFRYDNNRMLKLCDFGLSKMYTAQENNSFNVMTPIYRAPEIILQIKYSYKSDVWSVGCVFFELISKKHFININDSDNNLLMKKIISNIPERITTEYLLKIAPKHQLKIPKTTYKNSKRSLASQIGLNYDKILLFNNNSDKGTYEQFVDLLNKILVIDQNQRLSAKEALDHSFFDIFREYIDRCRKEYPPINKNYFNRNIKIVNKPERKWATNVAITLFNESYKINYSNLRYIFQAIDMFDRFLSANYIKLDNISSEIYFLACFNISIKYFVTFELPEPFETLIAPQFNNPETLKLVADFEWVLISEILKFEIYAPTVYETADFFDIKLDIQKAADLLSAYAHLEDTLGVNNEEVIYEGRLFDLFKKLIPDAKEKPIFTDKNDNLTIRVPDVPKTSVVNKNIKYVPTDIGNLQARLKGSNQVTQTNIGAQTAKPFNRKALIPGY